MPQKQAGVFQILALGGGFWAHGAQLEQPGPTRQQIVALLCSLHLRLLPGFVPAPPQHGCGRRAEAVAPARLIASTLGYGYTSQ